MQTGLIAVGILVILGLFFSLIMSIGEVKVLEAALAKEQERCQFLTEAREADHRAMATLLEAEQEARHESEERQKYIDTIHGALNGTGLLDALRLFGEAVCTYDPATRRVNCPDSTSGATGGDKGGQERGRVVGSGSEAD